LENISTNLEKLVKFMLGKKFQNFPFSQKNNKNLLGGKKIKKSMLSTT
jgi:hypothetical protein